MGIRIGASETCLRFKTLKPFGTTRVHSGRFRPTLDGVRALYGSVVDAPVASHSLAAFRILFGAIMALAMARLLALGWVDTLFTDPRLHVGYPGFEWIQAWPSPWMHLHVGVLGMCAIGIATGFYYRWSAFFFLLGFVYLELIDQTLYLNHYYLVALLAGILVCVPAHRIWSIDAVLRRGVRCEHVPSWTVNLLRFQIGIVYFFSGVAKLNADWLLRAQPLRIWLPARAELPLIGAVLDASWIAYVASWTGMLFDLAIPLCLLWRRTRLAAYASAVVFHIFTWILFPIGMFPWIMLGSALIFFPPDWPERMVNRSRSRPGRALLRTSSREVASRPAFPLRRWQQSLLATYMFGQVSLPLRGLFYTGPSGWSCNGYNFSWKVMLIEKTGWVTFFVLDRRTGVERVFDAADYLTPWQAAMLAQNPYVIRALAQKIARELDPVGSGHIQVRVDAYATMNGRPSQRLIDPLVDLAGPLPRDWIVPLQSQLPERASSDS